MFFVSGTEDLENVVTSDRNTFCVTFLPLFVTVLHRERVNIIWEPLVWVFIKSPN